jgi:hypothetical protein
MNALLRLTNTDNENRLLEALQDEYRNKRGTPEYRAAYQKFKDAVEIERNIGW